MRTLFWLFFFSILTLSFSILDDERAQKSGQIEIIGLQNRCRIPIDDEIYFYNFLKVEVK